MLIYNFVCSFLLFYLCVRLREKTVRNIEFQKGDIVVPDPDVLANPGKLRKLIGRAGCDIRLLRDGVEVVDVTDGDIHIQHPERAGSFTVSARNFIHRTPK